jgi:hypothetical protein
MTVSDIYKLLDKFSYCSYKDTFSLQTNRFPLFDLLDINWDKFENEQEKFKSFVYDGCDNTFFVCTYKNEPFLLINYLRKDNKYICHCTNVEIFEDVFMIILMKYAVRWNKCNCPSSEENSVNIIPI